MYRRFKKSIVVFGFCMLSIVTFSQSFYATLGTQFNQSRWKYTNIINKKMDGSGFGNIYAKTGVGYSVGFKKEIEQLRLPLVVEVNFMQSSHSIIYESGVLLNRRFGFGMGDYLEAFGARQYSTNEIKSSFLLGLGYGFLQKNPRWDMSATIYYSNSHIKSSEARSYESTMEQNEYTNESFENYSAQYGTQLPHLDADNEFSTHNLGFGVDVNFKFKKQGRLGLLFKGLIMGSDEKLYVFEEGYDQYNPETGNMERSELFLTKNIKINSCTFLLGLSYSL